MGWLNPTIKCFSCVRFRVSLIWILIQINHSCPIKYFFPIMRGFIFRWFRCECLLSKSTPLKCYTILQSQLHVVASWSHCKLSMWKQLLPPEKLSLYPGINHKWRAPVPCKGLSKFPSLRVHWNVSAYSIVICVFLRLLIFTLAHLLSIFLERGPLSSVVGMCLSVKSQDNLGYIGNLWKLSLMEYIMSL